jgi:hypothetical protein
MKLKTPLTKEMRLQMEELIAEAKQGFEFDLEEESKSKKVLDRVSALGAEIKKLQARFDGGDLDALESLSSKKLQLTLVCEQKTSPDAQRKSSKQRREGFNWLGLMTRMGGLVRPLLVSCQAERREEIAAMLRPLYSQEANARYAARQTDEDHGLSNVITYRLVDLTAPKSRVRFLSEMFQAILAGKDFWSLDPKITA